jgi:thiol-disulfide isomerase/thioredoxin
MTETILVRLLWTAALIGVGLGIYIIINRTLLRRGSGLLQRLPGLRKGVPAILYFTTPTCAPCKTIQRPALQQVRTKLGDRLQIIEVDAVSQPDLASAWNVLSVPTTYIIDAKGQPRHVNHGVAVAEKLLKQIAEIG